MIGDNQDYGYLLVHFGQAMIPRPRGRAVIRISRHGVFPTGGCLPLAPVWAVTRVRWRLGDGKWSVRLARGGGRKVLDRVLREEIVESREIGVRLALAWVDEVVSGSLDSELEPQ